MHDVRRGCAACWLALVFVWANSAAAQTGALLAEAAQPAASTEVQLRLTNTRPDKVGYHLVLPDAKPVFVRSISAEASTDVVSRPGQAEDDGGLIWFQEQFQDTGSGASTAQLVFGIPQTDAIQVVATCSETSGGNAKLVLSGDVQRLKAGAPVKARFRARGLDHTLSGVGVRDAVGEGQQGAEVAVSIDDPLWAAFGKLAAVDYAIGTAAPVRLPLKGIAKPMAAFLGMCRGFADSDALTAQDGGGSAGPSKAKSVKLAKVGDTCKAMAGVVSKPGGKPADVTFVNRTDEYRSVQMVDENGGIVHYADLEAGDSFEVTTDSRHPWMATDGPGNCIEIFMPRPGQAEIAITRPSPGFGSE